MRQPDEPVRPDIYSGDDGKLYTYDETKCVWVEYHRKPFRRFLLDRAKADWDANRHSIFVAILACIAPALVILVLALLP